MYHKSQASFSEILLHVHNTVKMYCSGTAGVGLPNQCSQKEFCPQSSGLVFVCLLFFSFCYISSPPPEW